MEDEAPRTEAGSQAEAAPELLIPSSAPTSPTPTATPGGTLSRLGLRSPGSPAAASGAAPGSPVERGQVSAITVVALLDKLVNMMEAVQDNQHRMEQRQADLEGAVRVVQGDVTRLSKTHAGTSSSVGKLLERSRKVGEHLKEVRERLDKQGVQVKKLEANHSHLLKRNHFKVLIFQVRPEPRLEPLLLLLLLLLLLFSLLEFPLNEDNQLSFCFQPRHLTCENIPRSNHNAPF